MCSAATHLCTETTRCDTPALVCDTDLLSEYCRDISASASEAGCILLFSVKAFSLVDALREIVTHVPGLSVSSLFEARLARDVLRRGGTVHMTTPGYVPGTMGTILALCDHISFNSVAQWLQHRSEAMGSVSPGIRVNPQLSFIDDERYDPCRQHSKLGVPLSQLVATLKTDPGSLDGIQGVHFHTNCDAESFEPLLKTVRHLDASISGLLARVEWVNLGGGYLFEEVDDVAPFHEAVGLLKGKYDVEVFVEPGAAIVRDACSLVSSVLDIFDSDGKAIAILDTTVNHLPEVLEFGFRPDVAGDKADGEHRYILAGCTCLSGDVFGEYGFDEPLEVGSRVVFPYCGAYSQTKWNWFNGVAPPSIYALTAGDGTPRLVRRFAYEDFLSWTGDGRDARD